MPLASLSAKMTENIKANSFYKNGISKEEYAFCMGRHANKHVN